MKHFESFLAPKLEEFLAYRENLGYAMRSYRSYLHTFDRYLKETKAERDVLCPGFFLDMRANLKMEARSVNRIISTARVFFQFLVRGEYFPQNPLRDIPLLKENAIIPFVFSPEQIHQLLKAICKRVRKTKDHFLHDLALYLAVLLMARCGMRISEPLRLLRHHYRGDDKTIYIEKTKFKKDRLIPVPKAVMREIENYLSVRKSLLPHDENPYLLAGRKQNPLMDYHVRFLFHQAVKDIGLDQSRKVIGTMSFSQPTAHSLRHSFAVSTLKEIKERGKSPQHALPILAAYMGHSEYKHTDKYLKVVDTTSRQRLVDFVISHKGEI
jgi:site-specific recombinase XerD